MQEYLRYFFKWVWMKFLC